MNNEKTNENKANTKKTNKLKTSSATIVVILITLFIAVMSGNSEATTVSAELENGLKYSVESKKQSVGNASAVIENGQVSFIGVELEQMN